MIQKTVVPHVAYNEVSIKNFDTLYSTILENVSKSNYIAVDTEFTGHCKRIVKNMEQRYDALAVVVKSHAIVSFGMTTLQELPSESNMAVYGAQNFEFLTSNQDTFQVDPGNLKFLAENGLDFNRHFQFGLPYHAGTHAVTSQRDIRSLWRDLLFTIRKNNIPIIVHNGLLDLMYIYQSFFAELPASLSIFVADLVEMFPSGIYDTKYLANQVLSEQKSYLAYLYCKYDRSRQQLTPGSSVATGNFAVRVGDPLVGSTVTTPLKRTADESVPLSQGSKRRMRAKKLNGLNKTPSIICHNYSNYGWCKSGKECLSSHDLDLILDKDQGIKREKEQTEVEVKEEEVGEEEIRETEEQDKAPSIEPNQRRDHAAHYDAFMTAFVFCHQASELGPVALKENINKINLMRLRIPLRVVKSHYSKPSSAWSSVRDKIWKPDNDD
ncbi:CCCH-type zinc finger transcription factor [Phycomyces blakesleeanus]|uniref:CCCH-type zinc finger transcription factor n=2 Tax=Phycomyces blakesleeanus TaxID=4837 RepID=A0A167NZD7_PHYB8|nr:CCCH-type zinc finger transcription factor [Phycomyces blakesleeanus NRRL 1555(-)]OAD76939.1 CCCH-type zinc finger transcription factor [Phycomyces blakesleeanus NRRL 1555(-)]|eukprot:XP_018294979.1 CCCH-type zinc finger transcription factor [Phycomyces blakesleeanus NRRL 1555(-)]